MIPAMDYAWWAYCSWVLVARHPERHQDFLAWWNRSWIYALYLLAIKYKILAFRDRSNLRNCSSTPWSQLWGYAWWARRPWVLVARHPARHPDLLAWWNGLRSYALAYVRPSSGRRLEHTLRQVERRRIRRRPEKKCDTVRLIVKKLRCVRKLCVNQWLCQDRHNYLTSKIYCRCQLWAQSV